MVGGPRERGLRSRRDRYPDRHAGRERETGSPGGLQRRRDGERETGRDRQAHRQAETDR